MFKEHNKRKILTRIISTALAFTIALTSIPLTVYADDDIGVKDDAGNGGNKTGNKSENQAESLGESVYGKDYYQGLRFYLVNADLERISDVYDFLFDGAPSSGFQDEFYETRFDTSTSPKGYEKNDMNKLQEWCTIPGKTTEAWTNPLQPVENLSATGEKFRSWFLNGINLHPSNPGDGSGLVNKGSSSSSSSTNDKELDEEKVNAEYTINEIPSSKITTGQSLISDSVKLDYSEVIKYYNIKVDTSAYSGISSGVGISEEEAYKLAYQDALKEAKQVAYREALNIVSNCRPAYTYAVKQYAKNYDNTSLYKCKIAVLTDLQAKVESSTSCKTVKTLVYRNLYYLCDLNEGDVYASYNLNADLLSSNIPLAGEDFSNVSEVQANSRAFCMLNKSDTIVIYDKVKYGENAATALADHNCLLIVEPILILKMMKQLGITNFAQSCLAKYYDKKYTYGSVQNIIDKWRGSQVSTYVPRIDLLFPNSLVTTRDYIANDGKAILGVDPNAQFYDNSSKRMTELDAAMQTVAEAGGQIKGIAMHVYNASDLGKTTSSTSTCDESLKAIGKSEDCSTKPEESSYGTLSKTVSIIKSYVTVKSDGTEQNDGYFIRENCCHTVEIEDEDDLGYTVTDWQTSSEKSLPYGLDETSSGKTDYTYQQLTSKSSKNQSGSGAGTTVILTENEFILYVKLVKTEDTPNTIRATGNYILYESEIAKSVSTENIIPIEIDYTFPKISFSDSTGCGNHHGCEDTDGDGDSDDHHYCSGASSSTGHVSNSDVTLITKNELESNYSNIIAKSAEQKFNSAMTTVKLDRGNNSNEFKDKGSHIYYFEIFRYAEGEQNLSLCKYNQNKSSNQDTLDTSTTNTNTVKNLGYNILSTKSTKNRATTDYSVNVSFKFVYDKANSPDKSTSYYLDKDTCPCGDKSVGGKSEPKDIDTATSVESNDNDIAVQVYSGSPNKTLHTKLWTEQLGKNGEHYLTIRDNKNKTVGRQIQNTATVKFNPFIRMTYSTVSDIKNGITKKYGVNVLSEYQRELLPVSYAEISWNYNENVNNLRLLSNMWATDSSLSNGDSWRKPNTVLKGGASCALEIKDSDMREVTLNTYQAVFPDSDISDYLINADNYTVDKAIQAHDDFIQSAVDTFEQLHIVQRITTSIETSGDLADENKVERSGNISFLNNGSSQASSDGKYYLSKDLSGLNASANEGDLDVKLGSTTKTYYKIWSDISGNVLIASGYDLNSLKNNLNGTVILTKNQDTSSLTNTTAKELNNRTLIIDKLVNAVERNKGNDTSAPWASDGKWYNESMAFYIMKQSTELKLGFRDVSTRTLVIDTRLIPYISSKSEQGKTAYTSQFTCDNHSEKWGSSEAGKIGEFKGKSIYMEDMNRLFTSKLFYIPNMTVQGSR